MKRIVATLVALPVLAIAGACSTDSDSASSGQDATSSGDADIAFVGYALADAFWQQSKCVAEEHADENGYKLDFQGPAAFDPPGELQTMTAVLQKRPEAIVLNPSDPNSFVAPVKQAMDSGIPVVTTNGTLAEPVEAQNVRTDGVAAGAEAADLLGDLMNGQGAVLIQGTVSSLPTLTERVDGFVDRMGEKFPDIEVLATQYSNGQVNKSSSDAENMVRAHPDIAGVYTATSFEASPTANALKAAGVLDDVNWVAWDATPTSIEMLGNGDIDAIVAQDPLEQTKLAYSMAHDLATGKIKVDEITEREVKVPAKFITTDNVDDPEIRELYEVGC
jgi:ribose transport system substrate-binding protein